MDIAPSSGKIAIVGYSKSRDITTKTQEIPILITMSSTGTYETKVNMHNGIAVGFQAVKWNNDESKILAFTGAAGEYYWRLYVITASGNQDKNFDSRTGTENYYVGKNGILIKGDYVYAAMQSTSSYKAVIIGFDYTQNGNQYANLYLTSTEATSFWDSLFSFPHDDSYLISMGTITYQSQVYWTIKLLQITNPTVVSWTSALPINVKSQYSDFIFVTDTYYYYSCAQDTGSTSNLYFRYKRIIDDTNPDQDDTLVSHDFADGASSCLGLQGSSSTIFAHVYTSSNQIFYLAILRIDPSAGGRIMKKVLTNLSNRGNVLVKGIYSSDPAKSYYILNMNKISSISGTDITLTKQAGAIMVEDVTGSSCLLETEEYIPEDEADLRLDTTTIPGQMADPMVAGVVNSFGMRSSYQVRSYNSIPYRTIPDTKLIKTSWCSPQITIVPSITTFSYTIYSGSDSIIFDAFETAQDCSDVTFSYKIVNQGSNSLSALFTYTDDTSTTVTILSTTESHEGTKQLDITGTINENGQTDTGTITVTIINPCIEAGVTIDQVDSIELDPYYIGDTNTYTMSDYFTSTLTYYSNCQKSYGIFIDVGLTTALASNAIFTLNSNGQLQIYNNDDTLHSTVETVYVTQYMTSDATIFQLQEITITLNKCKKTTIDVPAAANVYYDRSATAITPVFNPWTTSYGDVCGEFTYTFKYFDTTLNADNTTLVPASIYAITYNSAQQKFRVYTTKSEDIGVYTIEIQGKTGNDLITRTIYQQFHILIPCVVTAVSTDDQAYTVNSVPILTFQHRAFTQTNCVPSPATVQYTLKVDGKAILPTWMTYTSGTRTIIVAATTNTQKGKYACTLTGSFTSAWTGRTYTATTSFQITIIPENTNPPSMTAPVNQELTAGSQLKYSLGKVTDVDLDSYSIKATLGGASSFVTFSSPSFTIAPKASHVGTYTITVTVTDDNPAPLSVTYTFDITVKAGPTTDTNTEGSTSNSTFQGVIIGYDLPANASQADKDRKKLHDALYMNFGAKIQSISNVGVMIVQFLDDIIVPNVDYQQIFNDSIIKIQVTPSEYSDSNDLKFTWNCTSLSSTQMRIELDFEKPRKVSIQETRDSISIKFIQNGYFLQASTGRAIKYQTQISRQLPKQMDAGDAALLSAVGGSASDSLQGVMMSNLAVNIVMSASLQYLWGMINVLQIIVHMPLLSVDFPENAKALYSLIVAITKFDILPSQSMESQVFEFEDDGPFNESFQELDIFQQTNNMILLLNKLKSLTFHDMIVK